MLTKPGLYYRTIKHLKPIQIRYRLWYLLRDRFRKLTDHTYPLSIPKEGHRLNLQPDILKPATCNLQPATYNLQPTTRNLQPAAQFTFLNQLHTFEEAIDWNFSKFGKLWAYNLNYFDYLHQPQMTKEQGLKLIYDFIEKIDTNREGLEPYPISLRGLNWIKFLSRNQVGDEVIDAGLYAQFQILLDNPEYHLLGNHLLENAFSLLFGAHYFRNDEFLERSKNILRAQLEEQILADGGHFERSPMYHQIILERLLDGINLLKNNTSWKDEPALRSLMEKKAAKMLGWLQQLTFKNGDIPHVNDSTNNIAPDTEQLTSYAEKLSLKAERQKMDESGYRKFEKGPIELFVDIGKIGPDYQPAHAHSDTLSFILYANKKPVIVDTGVSTYEANKRRQLERSTSAHNTVTYGSTEQSEMWDAFRVGNRACPLDIVENENSIQASHSGYKALNITHRRMWSLTGEGLIIRDKIMGNPVETSTAHFHLYKGYHPQKVNSNEITLGNVNMSFEGAQDIVIAPYKHSSGFNLYQKAFKVKVHFGETLITQVSFGK